MIEVALSELSWLQRFFARENCLRWEDLAAETAPLEWANQVLPWLKFLQKMPLELPIVLPVFGSDGARLWYGVADSEQMTAQMTAEIQGFIGPSYSDFVGHLTELSSSDPLESVLRDRFGALGIRFQGESRADRQIIERQLLLYQSILARRPPVPQRGQRPFGRVRGDFDRALLAGNASGARMYLEELCASGRVSAEQRKCLEIRYLAGLGRSQELARDHTLISSVVDLPLPRQTLTDLVEALYRTHVIPVENTGDVELIRKTFRQAIARPYGALFRQWKGIRQPEVLRAFLLYESVLDEPNLARCEALIQAYPEGAAGRDLARRLFDTLRRSEVPGAGVVLDQAKQAIVDEDYSTGLDLCFKALPHPWAYTGLLRCAVELQSVEITSRVMDVIASAGETITSGFSKKDRERVDQLSTQPNQRSAVRYDDNWVSWANWVLAEPEGASPLTVLEAAVFTWNVADYASNPEMCRSLARVIGNARGTSEKTLRDAFPRLVEFFVESPTTSVRLFAPIYATLLKIIGWGGVASADELQLCYSTADALLATGPDKETYADCLEDLLEIRKANDAPSNLDWALSISELLILYPTQASDARMRFFMASVAMLQAWGHRVTAAQRSIIKLLASDYECPELLETLPTAEASEAQGSTESQFSGLIGIYTLSEGTGSRAKLALRELLPAARVEVNSDTVATDRLRSLAKSADVFAFAWKKSSHQAYYCAKDARSEEEMVMPQGGGTSSLVRAILSHVANLRR